MHPTDQPTHQDHARFVDAADDFPASWYENAAEPAAARAPLPCPRREMKAWADRERPTTVQTGAA